MLLLFFFHLALSIERPPEFGERGLPRFYAVSCRLKNQLSRLNGHTSGGSLAN